MPRLTRKAVQEKWPDAWSAWVDSEYRATGDVFSFSDGKLWVEPNDSQEPYFWDELKTRWCREDEDEDEDDESLSENVLGAFDKFMDNILLEERARQTVDADSEETPQRIRARARRERSTNLIRFGNDRGAR
jgi:hypothetical protein